MDVGIFDHVERRGADLGRLYADRLALLEVADRLGFYCYHVAEHHGTPLSMAPSPGLLLSAVAQRTEHIRLGPLCYILPLYDPLRLANEICMLDHLSGGRLDVGIGRGVSPIELGFFDLDASSTRAMFEEALEIILTALATRELSYTGTYHTYRSVPMELAPRQSPRPPLWYPTSGVSSIPWVAQHRFHTVFLGAPDHVADQVKRYEDSVGSADALKALKRGVLRYVFVAETDQAALAVARPTYRAHLANLHHLARSRNTADRRAIPDTAGARESNPEEIDEAVRKGWAAVGSPETVAEQIASMAETTGCNYLVFNPLLASVDYAFGRSSLELFGERVLPKIAPL